MSNNRTQIALVPHGKQRKGKSEHGLIIMKKIGYPLGESDMNRLIADPKQIPKQWYGKVPIFWRTIHLVKSAPESSAQTIHTIESWVKGMVFSAGLWHVESFPVDDDFSPNRLSVEIVAVPWWKRLFYKLMGKEL